MLSISCPEKGQGGRKLYKEGAFCQHIATTYLLVNYLSTTTISRTGQVGRKSPKYSCLPDNFEGKIIDFIYFSITEYFPWKDYRIIGKPFLMPKNLTVGYIRPYCIILPERQIILVF